MTTTNPIPYDVADSTHHELRKTPMAKVWMDGKLVDADQATVSVFDHGLLYGDGCFEGIRVYNGRIFKLASHLKRMYESAEKIRLVPPYTSQDIETAMRATLAANDLSDAYIRLVFTRGKGTLGLNPFLCPRSTAFIIADRIALYPDELYDSGMAIILSSRKRVPVESLDPAIKSLNYLNNILAKIESIDADVLEAVMLNADDDVAECTGDNIFMVSDGTIVTPPGDAGILHGVTRRFVIDTLAPQLGYRVSEERFGIDRLLDASEVFLTGTAAEIIGVTKIDEKTIGKGGIGPVTRALTKAFRDIVASNAPED